VYTIAKVYL